MCQKVLSNMSRPLIFSLSALTILSLALSACAETHTADIGTPVAVSHPVGAYSFEYRWGNNADVIYLVDNVSRADGDRVEFDLTVTVPPLGRMFGFVGLEVTCVAGDETSAAETDERLSEDYDGVFEFPMWCAVPEGVERLAIELEHHEKHLSFEGTVN